MWTGLKALSTLRRFRLKLHPFPSCSIFVKENRAFWKRSPKWISLKMPFLRRSVDCENGGFWKFCLLCAISFHTFAKYMLLCTLLILQSCKDDRTFPPNSCPAAKHKGSCVLDQIMGSVLCLFCLSSQWTFMRVFTKWQPPCSLSWNQHGSD